jgi:hypothetical protein
MTSDFEISFERHGDCVRLGLSGNFDEKSAHSLIERLQKDCQDAAVVFIQAGGLKNIRPSGCETFRKNLHVLQDFCYRLVFADTNAARMAPGWIQSF